MMRRAEFYLRSTTNFPGYQKSASDPAVCVYTVSSASETLGVAYPLSKLHRDQERNDPNLFSEDVVESGQRHC